MHSEDERLKERLIRRIERTVEKDTILVRRHPSRVRTTRCFQHERSAARGCHPLKAPVALMDDQVRMVASPHRSCKLDRRLLTGKRLAQTSLPAAPHLPACARLRQHVNRSHSGTDVSSRDVARLRWCFQGAIYCLQAFSYYNTPAGTGIDAVVLSPVPSVSVGLSLRWSPLPAEGVIKTVGTDEPQTGRERENWCWAKRVRLC